MAHRYHTRSKAGSHPAQDIDDHDPSTISSQISLWSKEKKETYLQLLMRELQQNTDSRQNDDVGNTSFTSVPDNNESENNVYNENHTFSSNEATGLVAGQYQPTKSSINVENVRTKFGDSSRESLNKFEQFDNYEPRRKQQPIPLIKVPRSNNTLQTPQFFFPPLTHESNVSTTRFMNSLPKMTHYDGKSDVVHFISLFKIHAQANGWSKEEQAQNLPLFLTGIAQDAHLMLSRSEKDNIDVALNALKEQLSPSEAEYLSRFKQLRPSVNQPTREFALELAKLYDRANPYAPREQRNRDLQLQLKDNLPKDKQYLILNTEIKDWSSIVTRVAGEVTELNPTDCGEETIVDINKTKFTQRSNQTNYKGKSFDPDYHRRFSQNRQQIQKQNYDLNTARHTPQLSRLDNRKNTVRQTNQNQLSNPHVNYECYNCGQTGHISANCNARAHPQYRGPGGKSKQE